MPSLYTTPTFVDRYVLPDGDIVPIEIVLREAGLSGFEVRDVENLREHYVLTLRHWARTWRIMPSRHGTPPMNPLTVRGDCIWRDQHISLRQGS